MLPFLFFGVVSWGLKGILYFSIGLVCCLLRAFVLVVFSLLGIALVCVDIFAWPKQPFLRANKKQHEFKKNLV